MYTLQQPSCRSMPAFLDDFGCSHTAVLHRSLVVTDLQQTTGGDWCSTTETLDGAPNVPMRVRVYRQGAQWVYEEESAVSLGPLDACSPITSTDLGCLPPQEGKLPLYNFRCRLFKPAV